MIIVDGYNVIYKWKSISKFVYNIDLARSRLVNILANYQGYIEEEVVIVFDSSIRKSAENSPDTPQNIKVIYAPNSQGADIFIEKMVSSHSKPESITVVTGDVLERTAVTGSGANSISPEKFEEEVVKICKKT